MGEKILQENLKRFREYNGYTQKQLAEYLEITRQAYANYEAGSRTPNYVVLARLSSFYGVSIDELVMQETEHEKKKAEKKASPYRYLPEQEQYLIEMLHELPEEEQEDLILYLKRKVVRNKEREGPQWNRK